MAPAAPEPPESELPVEPPLALPAPRGEDRALLEALTAPATDGETPAPLPVEPEPHHHQARGRHGKRGSRRGWLFLALGTALLLAPTGYFLLRGKGEEHARSVATRARLLDTPPALRAGLAELRASSSKKDSPTIAAESELLAALAWLHYRIGEAPPVRVRQIPYAHLLAAASVALAEHEAARARTLLKPEPPEVADLGLRSYLLARAAWLEGRSSEAQIELDRALSRLPRLSAALVLAGHLRREAGDLEGAERAYRHALKLSPDHELATLGLATILFQRGTSTPELEGLLAHRAASPLGQAWHRLLSGARRLHGGDFRLATDEIKAATAAAPREASFLFLGTQMLALCGQLAAARTSLDRLQHIRAETDPAVQILGAEVDIAQGLEGAAIQRLRGKELPPAGRRVLALALLLAGQPKRARPLLEGDRSATAQAYRLLAQALIDRLSRLAPLEELASHNSVAQLPLTLALLAREDLAGARQAAGQLVTHPRHRLRGLTLLAELNLREKKIDSALANLDLIARSSTDYLPALELQGLLFLQIGRLRESERSLSHARQGGRRTQPLLMGLLQVNLLLEHREKAATILEELKALGPSREGSTRLQGWSDLVEERPDRALASAGTAGEKDVLFLVALGQAQMGAGQMEQAESAWNAALRADPDHPLPYLRLGTLFAGQGLARAPQHFDKVIALGRQRPYIARSILAEAHLGLAACLLEAGRSGGAVLRHLKTAITLDPRSALAYRLLGELHLEGSKFRQAREALRRSTALDPEEATPFFLLGTACKGPAADARRALLRFLELEPEGERAAVARQALLNLR